MPRALQASGMQPGIVSGTEARKPNQSREPGIFEASGSRTVVLERTVRTSHNLSPNKTELKKHV